MKKRISISLLMLALLMVSFQGFAQKKIKKGSVKFELTMDADASPEMAMMGGSTLTFYFSESTQRMDMNMMGGLMRIQTIMPVKNPSDGAILMDMMGQQMQITEITEDELSGSNSFMNMDNVKKVVYNEKDKKDIAGYSCYKATIENNDGSKMSYYITEKIQPPLGVKEKNKAVLKGYPLEMVIDTGEGTKMTFTASEVSDKLASDSFIIPEGYTKMTMAEFEQTMNGGM